MFKKMHVRAVEIIRLTGPFEWYDNVVSLNKDDIGLYADDSNYPKKSTNRRK
jgi:hypothetical protein